MSAETFRRVAGDFAASTRDAKRILIIELAGLGDLVHSLPALWSIRKTYPAAELHCLVRSANASLLQLTPWIDRVLPYRRGGVGELGYHFGIARELRAQRYDLVIDLVGSDYGSAIAWLCAAPRRLIRRPGQSKPRHGWRWVATDVMEHPFRQEALYLQRWTCLAQAGVQTPRPQFQLDLDRLPQLPNTSQAGARPRYVHLSPYTRGQHKELPVALLAQLLTRLRAESPDIELAISCASKPRERAALDQLLRALPFEPWQVHAGTLDLPQLCGLIAHADLHLSGDSGSMHLAWMLGTPSLTWILHGGSMRQWSPEGAAHRHVTFADGAPPGNAVDQLLHPALQLLAAGQPARMRTRADFPMQAAEPAITPQFSLGG